MDFDTEDRLPRTASKTLRLDIMRMASIEKESRPSLEGHVLLQQEVCGAARAAPTCQWLLRPR